MADGRRQSANSRTSTPKPTAQGPGDSDDLLIKAVGTRVKITTAAPASITLEGTIYAICRITNLIAINTTPSPATAGANGASTTGDFHLIPFSRVQSFTTVAAPNSPVRAEGTSSGFEHVLPSITRVDLKALKAREEAAIRKIKEKDASRGKGVTKEAQQLFDAIGKTLPVRWHETSIIVLDTVLIKKPYKPEDCSAPKDKQNMLARVRKVVDNLWQKINAENMTKTAVVTPLEGPRKGG